MANPVHAQLLQEGAFEWNAWRQQEPEDRPDLVNIDLIDAELEGYDLREANLSGARLVGLTLRDCNLRDASLDNAHIENVAFTGTELGGVSLTQASLSHCVFTKCSLNNIDLARLTLEHTIFRQCELKTLASSDSTFRLVSLSDCDGADWRLVRSSVESLNMRDSRVSSIAIDQGELRGCTFVKNSMRSLQTRGGSITHSKLTQCDLASSSFVRSRLHDADFHSSNLNNALFQEIDFSTLVFGDASLVDAQLVAPQWNPRPKATSSWLGELRLPTNLPKHPISDIKGIPTTLRRWLSDAQFLAYVHDQTTSRPLARAALRLWGISSEYGQSATRWTLCCAFLIVAFALSYYPYVKPGPDTMATFETSTLLSVQTFLPLNSTPNGIDPQCAPLQRLRAAESFVSYFMLAGLVSILTNQLARRA